MDLTEHQRQILEEFRGRVEHLVPEAFKPDHELLRWLIARNFDIDRAERMLLRSLKWRKLWQVDEIMDWKWPEVLKKYTPFGLSGYDNEGCPVWVVPYCGHNLRGLLLSCNYRDVIKSMIYTLETSRLEMRKQSEKLGKLVYKHNGIFDLEGFSLLHYTSSPAKDVFPDLFKIYEANYPEHLKTAYLINAPKVFSVGFSIIKNLLGEATLGKIQIHSKDTWKDSLFKDIPRDQIPEYYGGTMVDPDGDPKCPSKITWSVEVPKSYYMNRDKSLKKPEDQYKTLNLSRGTKETIKIDVQHEGSGLKWEFLSDDFDVGFGISRLTPSGTEDVLIPVQRVNAQMVPDEGYLRLPEAATYHVVFDNEYSYFRSKKLKYNIEVIPPNSDTQITSL